MHHHIRIRQPRHRAHITHITTQKTIPTTQPRSNNLPATLPENRHHLTAQIPRSNDQQSPHILKKIHRHPTPVHP